MLDDIDDVDLYVSLLEKLNMAREIEQAYLLDDFLEVTAPNSYREYSDVRKNTNATFLTEEKRNLVKSFLGPYGDALLKAYKIRRGLP